MSSIVTILPVSENLAPRWNFLTNHARVLVCIADDPGLRLRDIAERIGITERAVHRIVVELGDAGYVTRERQGRRNQYTIRDHLPIHDPIAQNRDQSVGQLLQVLLAPEDSEPNGARPSAAVETAG
jgi:predicted transcriptional regulator